jgi:hypothetical protein
MKQDWHPEELALHWTLSESELELLGTKDGRHSAQFRHSSKDRRERFGRNPHGSSFQYVEGPFPML